MSDSEDSTVTYTKVSSLFEDLSDIGSSGVIVYGYNRLPMMPEDPYVEATLQASPSPDYVPGPEEPEQAPSPVYVPYVPEPVYPEFMPPEDEMLLVGEQPLHAAVSPTADSPGYIANSNLEEDPEEDLTDYPDDGGNDDDDDDESSDDDEDDDDVEEEEEEEHPAPADFVPSLVHCVTAKMSVRAQTPISLPSDTEVARLLAKPTPLPSPLSPLSSPLPPILSPLPQILSPPLLVSPPPLFASPTYPLGYRAAMIRLRAKTPTTSHSLPPPPSGTPPLLPIPAPTSLPPLLLPSTDHREDRPKVCLTPRKRLCIALGPRYEVGESSSASATRPPGGFRADYSFITTLDREIRRDPEREDTDEIYGRLNEAWDDRSLMSAQLNILRRDRCAHAHTALLMEREARLSHEAWRWSMDASDIARSEVMALRTTVLAQQVEIVALRTANRTRQAQLMETLRQVSSLQTQ
ncbi:hypothetical protein Tco_1128914 [Tanacetum coccineum]